MDVKEYRKTYEAELAAASSPEASADPTAPAPQGADASRDSALASIQEAPVARDELHTTVPALIRTLQNGAAPKAVRIAALRALRAARFLGEHFAPYHAEFLEACRKIVRPDTDADLRADALEVLARERDPYAQDIIRKGLENVQTALVPAAKGLQLLGYDDHANITDLARRLFEKAQDVATKAAALRILARDAKSQGILEQLLKDKSQPRVLRALSATGLHFLNPQKFGELARDIILDKSDFEDIRATSLGALATAPDHQHLREDTSFLDAVKQLGRDTGLPNLNAAVGRFLTKS
jgi:hypothetical protein